MSASNNNTNKPNKGFLAFIGQFVTTSVETAATTADTGLKVAQSLNKAMCGLQEFLDEDATSVANYLLLEVREASIRAELEQDEYFSTEYGITEDPRKMSREELKEAMKASWNKKKEEEKTLPAPTPAPSEEQKKE